MNKYIKRYLNSNSSSYIPLEDKGIVLSEAVATALRQLDTFMNKTKNDVTNLQKQAVPTPQPVAQTPTQPNQQQVIQQNQNAAVQQTATAKLQQSPQQPANINPNDPSLKALQQQNDTILKAQDNLQQQTAEVMKAQASAAQQQANPEAPGKPMVSKGGNFQGTIEVGDKIIPPAQKKIGLRPKQPVNTNRVLESTEPVIDSDALQLVNPYKTEKKIAKKKQKQEPKEQHTEQPVETKHNLLTDPGNFDHLEQLMHSIIDGSGLNDVMGDNIVIQMPNNVSKADISIHFEKDSKPQSDEEALDLYGGEDKIASTLLKDSPIKPVSPVVMQQLRGEASPLEYAMGAVNAPQEILSPEDDPSGLSVVAVQDNMNALRLLDL